jgi:hypothetical protein
LAFFPLYGQESIPNIPVPTAPYVVFPSPNVAFSIDVVLLADPTPNEASGTNIPGGGYLRMQRIDVTRTETLRHEVITWNNNTQTENWFDGKIGFLESPSNKDIAVIDLKRDPSGITFMARRDASDYFAWLSATNYEGTESYKGKLCYKFLTKLAASGEGSKPIWDKIAWIEVETKLPVALQMLQTLYTYDFHAAPTTSLILPPKFQEVFDRYNNSGH